MKQHILLATGIYPPDIWWPASYVPKIAKRMLQDHIIPLVITYSDSKFVQAYDTLGYRVVRITRSSFFVRHYLKYRRAVLEHWRGCDMIFLQDYSSSWIPTLLANLILRKRVIIKVVGIFSREQAQNRGVTTDILDTYVLRNQWWWLQLVKKFEAFLLHAADKVITPSNYMKELLTRFWVTKTPIEVIYNSFDPFAFTPIDVQATKREMAIDQKKIYVSVGRLVAWKNFDALIKSFQKVNNAVLYIIGDGPLKQQLQELIEQTGQTEKVILVGSLAKDQVYRYYQLADAFVLISDYEGMSHVLLEAMAMWLFIISSDITPNVETLQQYTRKRIVQISDAIDLTLSENIPEKAPSDLSAFDFELLYGKLKEVLRLK